jgi:NAD(P)-dependent dehydrogenase (short-subunit alcohol dehydrogenase family)
MNVMLADIAADAVSAAVKSLHDIGPNLRRCRSSQRRARRRRVVRGIRKRSCRLYNAGVTGGSGVDNISLETWRWVSIVNLMGVVHGVRTCVPHIRAHGEGGHIVKTAPIPRSAAVSASALCSEQVHRNQHVGEIGQSAEAAGWQVM